MPYILVRGNLASYGAKSPWRVLVSGLKAADIDQLKRFASGGYCDDSTIVYMQHPCVILTALEVLGYKVVASSSTSVKQDYNEQEIPNGVLLKESPIAVVNALSELGYKVVGTTGESEIVWTMQRDV
ncbi:hypothetical protein RN001_008905 [Aquatica leii]|uniref:GTP cyclohydrolase 1 feedback regulatory protein n=1 Tax=Aquatica leii TaxID=1421715 RepID=A0AAN7PXV8_9COLE|nr:hypothetical protein RN001_008905 [Aquatica leii]